MAARGLGRLFERVAEHGTRHRRCVCVEKGDESALITFPHLAQHPTDGFVHEIVRVVEQKLAERERVGEVVLPNEGAVARILIRRSHTLAEWAS